MSKLVASKARAERAKAEAMSPVVVNIFGTEWQLCFVKNVDVPETLDEEDWFFAASDDGRRGWKGPYECKGFFIKVFRSRRDQKKRFSVVVEMMLEGDAGDEADEENHTKGEWSFYTGPVFGETPQEAIDAWESAMSLMFDSLSLLERGGSCSEDLGEEYDGVEV